MRKGKGLPEILHNHSAEIRGGVINVLTAQLYMNKVIDIVLTPVHEFQISFKSYLGISIPHHNTLKKRCKLTVFTSPRCNSLDPYNSNMVEWATI